MTSFKLFLETYESVITGFAVREPAIRYNEKHIDNFYEAMKLCENKLTTMLLVIFADKTARILSRVHEENWHYTPSRIFSRDSENPTAQAAKAKTDPKFLTLIAIWHLINYLKPDYIPQTLPDHFWQYVNSALDQSAKTEEIRPIYELYDFLQENYSDIEGINSILTQIKDNLKIAGINI